MRWGNQRGKEIFWRRAQPSLLHFGRVCLSRFGSKATFPAVTAHQGFSKENRWARLLVGSSRNTCPLSHSPAADRARKGSPLVTGILVLGMRDRHWRATPQTHGLNELVLRLGLMSL